MWTIILIIGAAAAAIKLIFHWRENKGVGILIPKEWADIPGTLEWRQEKEWLQENDIKGEE